MRGTAQANTVFLMKKTTSAIKGDKTENEEAVGEHICVERGTLMIGNMDHWESRPENNKSFRRMVLEDNAEDQLLTLNTR